MLRITKSHTDNAVSYFEKGLQTEGQYYLDKGIEAHWKGKVAEKLNLLDRPVTKKNFSELVNNINPNTGEKLKVRNTERMVTGFDFTVSAVKSASLLHALTNDPEIFKAHQASYQRMMEEIEDFAQTQANTMHGRFYESTGSLIYSAYDHALSRPVEVSVDGKKQMISDPNMHAHLYAISATFSKKNQRFQALETFNIFKRAPYFEAVYHNHFSYLLNKAGYSVERNNDKYEVRSVSRSIIERFSLRTKEINKISQERGISNPKTKDKIGALSRNKKNESLPYEALKRHWEQRLSPSELKHLKSIKGKFPKANKEISAKEAIDLALKNHLERNTAIEVHKVLTFAAKISYGSLHMDQIKAELKSRSDVYYSDENSIEFLTTRDALEVEQALIKEIVSGKGKCPPLLENHEPTNPILNQQQQDVVKGVLLSSKSRVICLDGKAGTGKSTTLESIMSPLVNIDKNVLAVSPTARASREVLRSKGFKSADTISKLLSSRDLQDKIANGLLIVDEAAQADNRSLLDVIRLAREKGARVLLSGDPYQHQSVQASSYKAWNEKAKTETFRLNQIVRQKGELKEAVKQLAHGNTKSGFTRLNKMGKVKEEPDFDRRTEKIATTYIDTLKKGQSALIISPTNFERELLTEKVRTQQKQEGILKGHEHTFKTLKDLSFTEAQKKNLPSYQNDQTLRFLKNTKGGYKAGQYFRVIRDEHPEKGLQGIKLKDVSSGRIMPLPVEHSQQYQVYEQSEISIMQNDNLKLTTNMKVDNSKLNNGNVYTVKEVNQSGVTLSNGKRLGLEHIQHTRHAIVDTSFSSQGRDVDKAIISMTEMSFAASSQEQFYTSVSRAKKDVLIVTDDKSSLQRAIARSHESISATDVAVSHAYRLHQEKQRTFHYELNKNSRTHDRQTQRQPTLKGAISGHIGFGPEK